MTAPVTLYSQKATCVSCAILYLSLIRFYTHLDYFISVCASTDACVKGTWGGRADNMNVWTIKAFCRWTKK